MLFLGHCGLCHRGVAFGFIVVLCHSVNLILQSHQSCTAGLECNIRQQVSDRI